MTERMSRKELIRQQKKIVTAFGRLAFVTKIAAAVLYRANPDHVIFSERATIFTKEHFQAIKKFAEGDEYKKVMEKVEELIKGEEDEKTC